MGVLRDKISKLIDVELSTDSVDIIQAEPQTTSPSEVSLAKGHWKLKSEVSKPSFFENNYGFSKRDILQPPRATPSNPLFAKSVHSSPLLQFTRGFKSRRSPTSTSGTILGNVKKSAIPEIPPGTDITSFLKGYEAAKADPSCSTSQLSAAAKASAEASFTKSGRPEIPKGTADTASFLQGYEAAKGSSGSSKQTNKTLTKLWNGWKNVVFLMCSVWIVYYIWTVSTEGRGGLFSRGLDNEIAPEDIDVTFEDVMGCEEAKSELMEIVDFLTYPDKYSALGGRLPKGVLLTGPPGTGKTLLARAVAGEAGVPFFHAAGSEFDEVLVGQGARRVRDLFKTAKTRAPCVVFIDEIDTVGGKRTASALHPYANQTINQLLAEMDGFVANEGVIVLGATNRKDQLDSALLRPGRFDTSVEVPVPDLNGRLAILGLYLGKVKHDMSVDVEQLAKLTFGFTGAELENMVNTAAIKAASQAKEWVTMQDFIDSHDKITIGTDWKSRQKDKEDLKLTAYHEAGHTLVAMYTSDATPLHKVTIVSRGQSGGHTAFLPKKDITMQAKSELIARMDVGMGGRAAEEIVFGKDKITTGASSDLTGTTNIAQQMVTVLGMSEKVGLRVYEGSPSPAQEAVIDTEVNRLLNDSYSRALAVLKTHRHELDVLAEALLKYETLDAEDVQAIVDGNWAKRSSAKDQKARKAAFDLARQQPTSTPPPLIGEPVTGPKLRPNDQQPSLVKS